jgi:hypothetical protein
MSILDDAIREHLELKRAHGADESELKKLEDEAFGPPGRPDEPDPLAEAPTEFMATPGAAEAVEPGSEEGRRRVNIADLQEPPPAEAQEEPQAEAAESVAPEAEAPATPAEDAAQAAPPAEEEPPAMEHEVVPESEPEPAEPEPAAEEPGPGPETEERHAIAEQPTEFFDVEAEMGSEDAPAAEAPSPTDEEIVEVEREEPRLVPVADDEEEDEEFWSEQRLSDELDQALEAPITEEQEAPPAAADPSAVYEDADTEGEHDEAGEQQRPDYDPDTGHEDVLEDTPDFLEDTPEDDDLWFEQRPPKDFDFDD